MSLDNTPVKCKECDAVCPCASHGYGFADWPAPTGERRNGTDRRLAIAAQSTPTGNGAIVLDEVLRKIDNWINNYNPARTAGLTALREDLCARAEVGLRKYGTKLRVNNGRRAVVDLYQELMDALMYSMQARMEAAPSRATTASNYVELLLELSRQVAAELDAQ